MYHHQMAQEISCLFVSRLLWLKRPRALFSLRKKRANRKPSNGEIMVQKLLRCSSLKNEDILRSTVLFSVTKILYIEVEFMQQIFNLTWIAIIGSQIEQKKNYTDSAHGLLLNRWP